MKEDTTILPFRQSERIDDPLTEIAREGARRMLAEALVAEADAFVAGFSGDLLAVSWIGYDNNASTKLTGGSGALKVWAHFMARSSKRPLSYRMPDGIETSWINNGSGRLTGEGCPDARLLPFIAGSQPRDSTGCTVKKSAGIVDWFQSLFGRE